MVDKRGCGGLTIRSRDTNHLRVGVASCKLNLADDVDAFLHNLLNHGGGIGDAGTLDDLVGIEDLFLRVLSLLPLDIVGVHQLLVFLVNLRHVTDKYVEAFFLGEDGGTCAALSGS